MGELGVKFGTKTLNFLLQLAEKRSNIELALQFLDFMRNRGVKPNRKSYSILFSTLESVENSEKIIGDLFRRMEEKDGLKADRNIFLKILRIFAQEENVEAFEKWWDIAENREAIADMQFVKKLYPHQWTRLYVLARYSRMRNSTEEYNANIYSSYEWSYLKQQFKEMKEKKIPFNWETYSIAIDRCGLFSKFDEMKKFFEKMISSGYVPTASIYGNMIRYLGKTRDLQSVRYYYDHMIQRGIPTNIHVITELMKAFGESGDLKEMMNRYRSIKQHGEMRF
jgi:pentatricopeptide repeat protein